MKHEILSGNNAEIVESKNDEEFMKEFLFSMLKSRKDAPEETVADENTMLLFEEKANALVQHANNFAKEFLQQKFNGFDNFFQIQFHQIYAEKNQKVTNVDPIDPATINQ